MREWEEQGYVAGDSGEEREMTPAMRAVTYSWLEVSGSNPWGCGGEVICERIWKEPTKSLSELNGKWRLCRTPSGYPDFTESSWLYLS